MAYEKQTWVDRQVDYPMRFIMTENSDGTITLTPNPGLVSNEGTNITAERMNHIEDGIYSLSASIKILSGTITTPDTTSATVAGTAIIDYPEGFNSTNCIVIGLINSGKTGDNSFSTTAPIDVSGYLHGGSGLVAILGEDHITVQKRKIDTIEASLTTAFKIALLKIL